MSLLSSNRPFGPPRRQFIIRSFTNLPYSRATRHPLPCLLFLLPLLAAYELGVVWVGGTQADSLRNGADTWLRWGLDAFGLNSLYWAPLLLLVVFALWSLLRREDRPDDVVGICLGMAIESVSLGLGLWGLSRGLGPLLDSLTAEIATPGPTLDGVAQVVSYLGAGIYEEMIFRLVLFSGLVGGLRLLQTPPALVVPVAALVSATLFAAAHHIGPYGEPLDEYVFLFRTLAGLYFAAVYRLRGFGIVVGAHACYDVMVG